MKKFTKLKILSFLSIPIVIMAFEIVPGISGDGLQNPASVGHYPAEGKGCLACHTGIEPIRQHDSKMMKAIYREGSKQGDPNGCVVCHYGNPAEENNKEKAHSGMIIHPGSMWTEDKTCGKCHEDHFYNLHRNLMQTEAGKIQGAVWGWGALEGYDVKWGNYDVEDPDGPEPRWGTEVYKKYMHRLKEKYPQVFPQRLSELPSTGTSLLASHPEQAVFTYLRGECLRCHVGVRGKQRRGDYRGMGCAACHIPYSDEGLYEGGDPTISKDKPGHLLVHSIQSSRKVKVTVNGKTYSGIPSEQCTTCHNRGKRIGVSYLGLIESAYDTPWNEDGTGEPKLHGKTYQYIREDVHHRIDSRDGNPVGNMLCQDCHTTISMHGNGNIDGTTLAAVEIECADCHGTPEKYPWELPVGFQDEFGLPLEESPRGVTFKLLDVQKDFSTVYEPQDGYLLSARGNPLGNVVRKGDEVIVHSANGLDFNVPVLKEINLNNLWKHPEKAMTAMVNIDEHIEKMECYACHATWAPQCYGCHVKIDFSNEKTTFDWIKAGKTHFADGETAESSGEYPDMTIPGKAKEGRSYVRWENPVLGVNGEGRITPIIPGCQQITTVLDNNGKAIVSNKIWRTPPYMENGGAKGQRGIDMSPAQPHTISLQSRDCNDCHTNPKTLGYGIGDGRFMSGYENDRFTDLKNANGENISIHSRPQIPKIEDLPVDLSQVVTRDGKQLQTVGHHWPLSAPLSQNTREKMERSGVCISCHQDVPEGTIFTKMTAAAGEILGMIPHSDHEHTKLLNSDIRWAAMTRILFPLSVILILILGFWVWKLKRR